MIFIATNQNALNSCTTILKADENYSVIVRYEDVNWSRIKRITIATTKITIFNDNL